MDARVSSFVVALGFFCVASGCGVVRYREVSFTVRDEASNAPIPQARVSVQMMGVTGKLNAGRVPLIQSGATDQQGVWKATVPMDRCGSFIVDSDAYEQKLVDIQQGTLNDGKLDVKLKPAAKKPPSQKVPSWAPAAPAT
jgi:hypothetical protein